MSEKGWLPAAKAGRGCCAGEQCGQQDTAPWGAGGQEERSRGGGDSFHSQAQIILSKAGRGCLWERTGNRARFPCAHPLRLFLLTPVLISLLNQPSCQIFTFAFAAGRSHGLAVTRAYFLVIWLSFQAGKNLVALLLFLLLWHIKTDLKKKKGFDYTRSFKRNCFPQVRQYRKSDSSDILRGWNYFFMVLMLHSECVTFF